MEKNYVLGLDIGIASVGWGLLELDETKKPFRILDVGSRIFSAGEETTGESKNYDRRMRRLSRRTIWRKSHRLARIRYLLSQYGYLGEIGKRLPVHEAEETLLIQFEKELEKYYRNKKVNPYQLKVKALEEALSNIELAIVLHHYGKYRGYKSNREEDALDENGVVKKAILQNKEKMKDKGYRTISEMFVLDSLFATKIHNAPNDYKMSVTREMYKEEINLVLDTQIGLGTISKQFKEDYIQIWKGQRSYAKGPGGDSPYGGDLIARMTGTCKFTKEPRAPKCAPSTELFVALTKLVNLRYKIGKYGTYQALDETQIGEIVMLALSQEKITYQSVCKKLSLENVGFKDVELSKEEYRKCIKKFKKEVLRLPADNTDKVTINSLPALEKQKYQDLLKMETLKKNFFSLKTYHTFKKAFTTNMGTSIWEQIKDEFALLDKIATILTNYKVDDDVLLALQRENINREYTDTIINLPNLKEHIMISLSLLYKLIPLMKKGKTYDKAMEEIGYNHSIIDENTEKHDLLIAMNHDFEINNQRVIRSLAQTRKVINSVIKKYGMPQQINVETARELSKTIEERRKILNKNRENRTNNVAIKQKIVQLFPHIFKDIAYVTGQDILKYRLWLEQNETCSYSLEKIRVEDLFEKNMIQIDHILPYSRTFDDSYLNKTLVKTKCNQEKRNRTPYEYFENTDKWKLFAQFINTLTISDRKKDIYLLKNLTSEMESEYRSQNLNDTKMIAKYLVAYLKAHLNVPKIMSVNGTITSKLRARWHLNGLTHSLESKTYYASSEKDPDKKNRDNHLHHAMDALVIAATTQVMIQKVTSYEKYHRYINGKTETQINAIAHSNDLYEIDEETIFDGDGLVIKTTLKEYVKEMLIQKYLQRKNNNTLEVLFPTPYDDFTKEAKIRVYEQDNTVMRQSLRRMNTYGDEELNQAGPIIPSLAKNRVGGPLHKETYYGIKKGMDTTKLTLRMDIASSLFTADKLENISDKKGGSKMVYQVVQEWIQGFANGALAYKNHQGYPVNPKTGNMIKKVKLESEYTGKEHIVKNKYVKKENICQIEVYKNDGSETLFFVGLDYLDLLTIRSGKDCRIILWWGRSNAQESRMYSSIVEDYKLYTILVKNDFVQVYHSDGTTANGYVNGFSSGRLELKGAFEKNLYLLKKDGELVPTKDRYNPTVSTIKSIKKIKLTTLGKIENGI